MKTHFAHMQFNVHFENVPFYKGLFGFLGWTTIHEDGGFFGVTGANGESFWFVGQVKAGVSNDYDGPGVNHIAIGAESITDVDALATYVTELGIAPLFDTPRHRPDFAASDDRTYYQVMFETPDRLLLEFVYAGPLQV